MAVKHGVTDSDKRFLIDPITRTINNQSGKLILIQYDHNSERFTFQCPRLVDGHDMSLCNRVEIHFINTGTGNARTNGLYEVNDLHIIGDNEDAVAFTWLISQNATRHVGKLNFAIRFACVDEESVVEYTWNTGIYSDIVISKSIFNSEDIIEDYVDVLEMWKQDLYSAGLKISSVEQTVTSYDDGGINVITMTLTDGSTTTFQIQNGSKGPSGTNGRDGTSIRNIARTSGNGAAGTTDTYTITLTDGSTTTFQVYNGANGANGAPGDGSGDMTAALYDPQGKRTDVFQYVDNAIQSIDISGAAYEFYAVYETTTSAEIEAAYVAGKKIYCINNAGAICPLYQRYSEIIHCFYRGGYYIYCTNDSWTESCPYEGSSNKVTEITAESTDDKYPSAKAVYVLVNAAITGAIEGSY